MKDFFKKIIHYIKTHPKLDIAVLVLGLAIFATITFINAPRASIWFDEAFSAYISQFNFWDIARYTASDVHPPLYYWLLKIWSTFFGTTDLAYRSLSIVFGAATVGVSFFLSRKLFGRKVAWVSLLFLILSPMLIRYSDEARMYTLAALIVMIATYVLIKARETGSRKLWVIYGVLVALGMWTHYFTALAWIAHWAWQALLVKKKGMGLRVFFKKLFAKDWIIAYLVAVGLFLPWLPFMALQLGIVQGGGFWIGPVTINSPANYFTNVFYYLEHEQVYNWLALGIMAVLTLVVALLPRVYRSLAASEKKTFLLIAAMAWVPIILLILASMPPLRSSFVERYTIPAIIALMIFMAVILVVGTRRWRPIFRMIPVVVIAAMMIFGVTNVYKYGNFNKNTSYHIFTRQVVEQIQQSNTAGEPIVAQSPWVFYEAIPYTTAEHPVYFIGATANDNVGSLAMLQDNDMHKITDIDAFTNEHPVIWYIGQSSTDDVPPYQKSWQKLRTVFVTDEITGKTIYRATEYKVK